MIQSNTRISLLKKRRKIPSSKKQKASLKASFLKIKINKRMYK